MLKFKSSNFFYIFLLIFIIFLIKKITKKIPNFNYKNNSKKISNNNLLVKKIEKDYPKDIINSRKHKRYPVRKNYGNLILSSYSNGIKLNSWDIQLINISKNGLLLSSLIEIDMTHNHFKFKIKDIELDSIEILSVRSSQKDEDYYEYGVKYHSCVSPEIRNYIFDYFKEDINKTSK